MKKILEHIIDNFIVNAFVGVVAFLSFGTCIRMRGNVQEWYKEILHLKLTSVAQEIENKTSDSLIGQKYFVDIYGLSFRIMGRHTMQDSEKTVVKDGEGNLHFLNERISSEQSADIVQNITNLNEHCENNGILFSYVSIPSKEEKYKDELPAGLVDFSYENKEEVLSALEKNNVRTLDLAEEIDSLSYYKTDHHWTIESAWRTADVLGNYLNQSLPLDYDLEKLFSKDNFQWIQSNQYYVGSEGRRTGTLYTGTDDFYYIIPNFETDFEYYHYKNDTLTLNKEGNFSDALLAQPADAIFSPEYYLTYSNNAQQCEIHIINKKAKNDLKILVIGDSFTRPLAAYMSLYVKEVVNIDTQEGRFQKNVLEFINEIQPDCVLVAQNSAMYGETGVFDYSEKGDYRDSDFETEGIEQ